MEYKNELLEEWVGRPVVLGYAEAPDLKNKEEIENVFHNPGYGYEGPAKHRTSVYLLMSYDNIGINVKTMEEGSAYTFMPWGAVLSIQGDTETEESKRD